MARRSLALAVLCIGALLALPVLAQADTSDIIEPQHTPGTAADGWQAGNCSTDEPEAGEPKVKCSPETEGSFFKKAGGHPPVGFTQYIIQHTSPIPGVLEPIVEPLEGRDIKTLRVDLPPGLTVNPEATGEKCTLAEFLHSPAPGVFVPECKPATKTGEEQATVVVNEAGFELEPGKPLPLGARIPLIPGVFQIPVYNLVPNSLGPESREPALFGFVVAGKEPIFLRTEVSWESDYHESFTIHIPAEAEGTGLQTLISRLVSFGQATGNGTYITNPTTCFDPEESSTEHLYSTWFRAESFEEPNPTFPSGSTPIEAPLPEGVRQSGCPKVPFEPEIEVEPGTTKVDSPAGPTVTTEMPFEVPSGGEHETAQSQLRSVAVTMPAGMGLNPSGSVGLVACSDAEFHMGERVDANSCPVASEIGTAEIATPVLSEPLIGKMYVGEQKSSDPTSGDEFRMMVEADALPLGVVTRLLGKVSANPTTGQLTASFDEQETSPLFGALPEGLPQVPFESVTLKFSPSASVLTSAPVCAPLVASSTMEPWSTPASTKHPTAESELSAAPGGGACPKTLGTRPFTPSYTATSQSNQGGAYSPFRVQITRVDGQQELKVVDATLPPGLAGSLKGIPYCSDASLAAAAAAAGKAEQASPSCSSASLVGEAQTESGSGPKPAKLSGKVYLAGPYKGAPVSLAVITPAVSGPFDLGTVVVRIALNVDPKTTQVTAVSDAIPDVYGGVKLDIRKIDLNLNREKFVHNPTNCNPSATTGTIKGGGSDPSNPAAFSSYPFSSPYQATGCNSLAFKPKLQTKLLGGRSATKRLANPKLKATLEARETDANIQRTALVLSASEQLAQGHIGTVCTNPQLASHTCPSTSVYGKATAVSPLLNEPLSGPVYLVPSGNKLPDLVADLRGQIEVQLHGVIGNQKGAGLKAVFNALPDAPVTKFTLEMNGGKKGLLVNSKDLCKHPAKSQLNIKAQNGKQVKNSKLPLQTSGCPKNKKKK